MSLFERGCLIDISSLQPVEPTHRLSAPGEVEKRLVPFLPRYYSRLSRHGGLEENVKAFA